MPADPAAAHDLDYWLTHIASVHPREIELGLERIRTVASRMGLGKPAPRWRWWLGTNGKGSCIAAMEAILLEAGCRTAAYTSPHLHRFTERISLNGNEVDEETLCPAFARVEACRGAVSLSYFEFSTLAALWLFHCMQPDVALLEVGLGGRLDAVNIVDGDVTLIASVGLDHQDWLGHSRELIGREKAGILRPGVPLVYGDADPVAGVTAQAEKLAAPLYLAGRDFHCTPDTDGKHWQWRGGRSGRILDKLPATGILPANAAMAIQALELLDLELPAGPVAGALNSVRLAGRQETRRDRETGVRLMLDVAHNPAAMQLLGERLDREKARTPGLAQITVVMAVMADKDIEGMAAALESRADIWYIAQVEEPRCMPVEQAVRRLAGRASDRGRFFRDRFFQEESLPAAYERACRTAKSFAAENPGKTSLVVVTGSFHGVAAVRELSEPLP